MEVNKKLYCAQCGNEIGNITYDSIPEKGYYKVLDNYLQVKYFDSENDNIFCSKDCVCEAISLDFVYLDNDVEG